MNIFNIKNSNLENLPLEKLVDKERMSVRTVNICKDADLLSLNHILDFYSQKGSFRNLRNCGDKTDKELIAICKKYLVSIPVNGVTEKTESILVTINSLTPIQKLILNRHFEYLISKLNVRSYNGLIRIHKSLNTKEIYEKIFSEQFNFKNIKKIGNKSAEELEKLKFELTRFVNILQTTPKDQLIKEYIKQIVKKTFANLPDNFDDQFENHFDENGKLKLFSLLQFMTNSGQLFLEKKQKIFAVTYTKTIKYHTLDSVGKGLNITRERVRQIKSQLEKNITNYFLFVSNLVVDDLVNYNINVTDLIITIDNSFANKLKIRENVNFNILFYSTILGIFLKNTHSTFGDNDIICRKKRTANQKILKNYYLINSILFNCFNFEKFIEDIYIKSKDRINETYSLNFKGYIYEFLKEDGKSYFHDIIAVCENLIFNEFELVVTNDGYLIFEQNTKKPVHQYYYEILEEKGDWMNISDITNAANQRFPFIEVKDTSVRGILNKEKNLFIFRGRSSTYGLRKWENEEGCVKGGTIREIVEEFLALVNTPKHISEILDYVLQYRPATNAKSILSNIKAEESNTFCFYVGDFVGLQAKNYSSKDVVFKKIIGSHFRNSVFVKMNGWHINDIVKHYVNSLGYTADQIELLLKKKIEDNELKFSQENKLTI
jgi:hypothetical protein